MRKFGLALLTLILLTILAACGGDSEGEALDESTIKLGVTSGPHEQIGEILVEVAADHGVELEVTSFSDFVLPNTALHEYDLDINSYQHVPFLDEFNEDHSTDLVPVADTILIPMGIFSDKYDTLEDLPDGATFGLPNDPTNGGRALFLLEEAGYITLDEGEGLTASVHDVAENPKNLEFVELDAAQIPNQLSELDAAAINSNFALAAGLQPKEESIILESTDSPYVNVIAVRAENVDDPAVEKFIEIYQSDEVKAFIEEEFQGSVLAGW